MKLSDALRGAADRAPVEDGLISVSSVSSKVRRQRAVRTGSAGLVGAGACALLVFAAMGPLSSPGTARDEATVGGLAEGEMDAALEDSAGAAADGAAGLSRPAEQWSCGATFDANDGTWSWGDTTGATFDAAEPAWDGEAWQLPSTLTAQRAIDLVSSPDYVVVWDGIIVGRLIHEDPIPYGPADEPLAPSDGEYARLDPATDAGSISQDTTLEAVNCWDGEPLPAGKYEVHQAWTLAYAATATPEPTESAPEPSTAASTGTVTEGSEDDAAAGGGTDGSEGSAQAWFRVAAAPVGLVIDGDPVDDPFGDYLGGDTPGEPVPLPEPVDPVEPTLPDGALTTDLARELYEAALVRGPWDMAEGSQRWIKVNDSREASPDGAWEYQYYGCTWGDGRDGGFPTQSADMGLLDVSAKVPASLSVSYGYVVDGNPLATTSVTNVSEYAIPGYWYGDNVQLALVRDGVVAAEIYPETISSGTGGVMEPAWGETAVMPDGDYWLSPGATSKGEGLLRNANSCSGDGSGVQPGTYTLLAQVSLYMDGASTVAYGGAVDDMSVLEREASTLDSLTGAVDTPSAWSELTIGDAAEPAPDTAIAYEENYDWIEFQVWTSLGTITVR
ncbi:hypothetical protein [Demequina sp.]|uniref:hypothetical protein n=1 Tax=Demequina sp. TaxID=2050685 RepID=UPI003A85EE4A